MNPVSLIDRPMLSTAAAPRPRGDTRWLVTFTDLAALLVAFFVLLFSMAEVDSEKWQGTTSAFDRQFRMSDTTVTPRPVETSNITQRIEVPALDLGYLARVIDEQVKANPALHDVRLAANSDRLVLDFPGALVFADGRIGVSQSGLQVLFVLGGLFAGIDNEIIVVGDAPTLPSGSGPASIGWQTSLERGARVARALRSTGYSRPIVVQGRIGSRLGDPERNQAEADASGQQRIEIIVLNDTGVGQ